MRGRLFCSVRHISRLLLPEYQCYICGRYYAFYKEKFYKNLSRFKLYWFSLVFSKRPVMACSNGFRLSAALSLTRVLSSAVLLFPSARLRHQWHQRQVQQPCRPALPRAAQGAGLPGHPEARHWRKRGTDVSAAGGGGLQPTCSAGSASCPSRTSGPDSLTRKRHGAGCIIHHPAQKRCREHYTAVLQHHFYLSADQHWPHFTCFLFKDTSFKEFPGFWLFFVSICNNKNMPIDLGRK